jgi:hypothetical protein
MSDDLAPPVTHIENPLVAETRADAVATLSSLYRLFGEDDGLRQALQAMVAAPVDPAPEPIVIAVESFGVTEFVTLAEYIDLYIADRELGLGYAREVLTHSPQPFVYNHDDCIREPQYLQLHRTIDPSLLETEIERMELKSAEAPQSSQADS